MKRLITLLLSLSMAMAMNAQTENMNGELQDIDNQRYKDFDGFLLDMGTMLDMSAWMAPPTLSCRPFDALLPSSPYSINPEAVRINPSLTLKGPVPGMSLLRSFRSLYGPAGGNVNWQGASFRLNNGMRINTYGEYNADGYKVYNPAALPWEKNDFNAAFEFKSADGKFGIMFEVHGGRNSLY